MLRLLAFTISIIVLLACFASGRPSQELHEKYKWTLSDPDGVVCNVGLLVDPDRPKKKELIHVSWFRPNKQAATTILRIRDGKVREVANTTWPNVDWQTFATRTRDARAQMILFKSGEQTVCLTTWNGGKIKAGRVIAKLRGTWENPEVLVKLDDVDNDGIDEMFTYYGGQVWLYKWNGTHFTPRTAYGPTKYFHLVDLLATGRKGMITYFSRETDGTKPGYYFAEWTGSKFRTTYRFPGRVQTFGHLIHRDSVDVLVTDKKDRPCVISDIGNVLKGESPVLTPVHFSGSRIDSGLLFEPASGDVDGDGYDEFLNHQASKTELLKIIKKTITSVGSYDKIGIVELVADIDGDGRSDFVVHFNSAAIHIFGR